MALPKVIFLDAVGTLFGVKHSVGHIYSTIAAGEGVQIDEVVLNDAFYDVFKAAPSPVFTGVDSQQIPEEEFQWWKDIMEETFAQVGIMPEDFPDFKGFFTRVYAYFATSGPWEIYPDVVPTLENWRSQGIELGIISNFDSRLYAVIELLGLRQYFQSITISSTTGSAKPSAQIFLSALQKHQCTPEQAWHIGDSKEDDYEGAIAMGIKAFLVSRD
jgi:putative hydrolase of the HAD superfamily